jgi:protein Mpv17
MTRHAYILAVLCLFASARPCAAFSPALAKLPLSRPATKLSSPRIWPRAPRMSMNMDIGTTLSIAQAANDILAAPGTAYSYYLGALDANAMAVDSTTAAFLYGLGTVTSSAISNKWERNMVQKVSTWSALGVLDGICTHSWYELIQGVADAIQVDKVTESVVMMLSTSLLYTPVYCAGFLVCLSLLEGKGWNGAMERLQLDYSALFTKTTKVWGPTNALLFGLVPLHLRTLTSMGIHYVFLVGLALWDAALRESRSQGTAAGPEMPEPGSASEVLNLRLATAFVPVDCQRDLDVLAGDGDSIPMLDA